MNENSHPAAEAFRLSLRGLGASVTIIATQCGGVRYGMVATAVMSVSMDPPSLVIAVNSSASIHEPISRRQAFTVNVLGEWDERVARGFAKASGEARFAYGAWSARSIDKSGDHPLPYLANGQASIVCSVRQSVPFGSHTLFIGEVQDVVASGENAPLLYCDGSYGSFSNEPELLAVSKSA